MESISNKILNLKLDFNEEDIEVRNLIEVNDKLSIINSYKSRKEVEKALYNVRNQYGIDLEEMKGRLHNN